MSMWRLQDKLRDKFLFFSVYFEANFPSQAILQNALQLSIVSSQIIENNLKFCVATISSCSQHRNSVFTYFIYMFLLETLSSFTC